MEYYGFCSDCLSKASGNPGYRQVKPQGRRTQAVNNGTGPPPGAGHFCCSQDDLEWRSNAVRIIIALILIVSALLGCAPPSLKTTALLPARAHEASLLKEVAVLPFDGPGGKNFAAEIEGTLAGINIGDRQYFSLVDRTKIDRLIEELNFSQSALMDPGNVARLGKLVGARGIYTGSITLSRSNDNRYQEERTRCASEVTKKNEKGKEYRECVRWVKYNVSCTSRVASFAATPKLLEVETGRIVYASNISGTARSSACEDSPRPLVSHSELLEQAKQQAKHSFRADVAPHYVTVSVQLMDSTDGMTSREAERLFKQGLEFAKNNRLDRACELWGEARALSQPTAALLYDLGICSEITGDLEQALDLYRKSDRLLTKPDDKITAALGRVSKAIQDRRKIKDQLGK